MNDFSDTVAAPASELSLLEEKLRERLPRVMEDSVLQQSASFAPSDYFWFLFVAVILPALILIWGWY
jgi:hypothetical protein